MIESLGLSHVGPAAEMTASFTPRLNVITGDNGLGKSFLLDVTWWALTRTWARESVVPKPGVNAEISYQYTKKTKPSYSYTSKYEPSRERWTVKNSRPPIPGLILYAQVDGGFSVWDPTRNYWTEDAPERPNAFLFAPGEVWEGNKHCKGLIDDWALWQAGNDRSFAVLKQVLEILSPSPSEKLVPGDLRKLTVMDPQRYPTLRMPYGEDVAVIHSSAGMRRVLALSYLLTWAWNEHVENAKIRGEAPTREIVFLFDEIEAHLHPQWQRRIVPALLSVMDTLTGEHGTKVQLIATTHSPLVLASIEPLFDDSQDSLFALELQDGGVELRCLPWAKQGDVALWLVSDSFGLRQGRSLEAERAIEAAEAWMRGDATALPSDLASRDAIHRELLRVLAGNDYFWPRWIVKLEAEAQGKT